ncbi:MAG TPA: protein kinase, partial [Pirellulaceae bacterium]|nr:protein kinase [Pirellulaceae bacterium]
MTQCLSEADILGYIQGSVDDQQRSAFDEHVSSCPNCQARVEIARESSLDVRSPATHQAITQVEATSAHEIEPAKAAGSHWTDGDVASQVVIQVPQTAPKVSLDEFLTGLSQSGLMPAAEVASVRDRSHKDPATSTVAGLIEWLVQEHKLTRYQANLLARGHRHGLVLGNYVIQDKLGQGGMGAVFKARHRRMNRLVALKVLPQSLSSIPEAIARFQREVEAAARLTHPNIAAAYDADEAGGVHFLVMEYVEGPTLANYVKHRGSLPVA